MHGRGVHRRPPRGGHVAGRVHRAREREAADDGQRDVAHAEGAPRLGAADLLRIATVNGARTLGLEAETGTVAPGKRADLVVLDEDPLEAPAVLGQPVAALLVEGRLAVDRIGL
ncbi:MAG: amidohydrolase family protein [Myxococcota bacterium]